MSGTALLECKAHVALHEPLSMKIRLFILFHRSTIIFKTMLPVVALNTFEEHLLGLEYGLLSVSSDLSLREL